MATTSTAIAARRNTAGRIARAVDRWLLPIYVVLVTAYLILPVAVMIVSQSVHVDTLQPFHGLGTVVTLGPS